MRAGCRCDSSLFEGIHAFVKPGDPTEPLDIPALASTKRPTGWYVKGAEKVEEMTTTET